MIEPAAEGSIVVAARAAGRDGRSHLPVPLGSVPLVPTDNAALSAQAGLHWRGRLVELILPALFSRVTSQPGSP